ncbi:MAG: FAD-dependent thymidylate synthase [Candidatus Coatesbacteria bacterium]
MGRTAETNRTSEHEASSRHVTRRATVPALEAVLGRAFPVLDHGFVRVVDYLGDDAAIVQAARVSYGRGTKSVSNDRGLIRYLLRHAHTTPFEMCEIKFHVKLPIFVARQWVRHRTASVNEMSGRYSILDREFYSPQPAVLGVQDASARQGRGKALPGPQARRILSILKRDATTAYAHYGEFLGPRGTEQPLARELARIGLPVSFYTQWYWKIDLHNLLHFIALRLTGHAQFEIRAYAQAMAAIVKRWVPLAWEAFDDYRMSAVRLSRVEAGVVRALLRGGDARALAAQLSARERDELAAALGIDLNRLA